MPEAGDISSVQEEVRELVAEIKSGNNNAFQILFYSYYQRLVDFCIYRTKDLETSKDLI